MNTYPLTIIVISGRYWIE